MAQIGVGPLPNGGGNFLHGIAALGKGQNPTGLDNGKQQGQTPCG